VHAKKCENISFKVQALHRLGEIMTGSVDDCVKHITCSVDHKLCMYRQCISCCSKQMAFAEDVAEDTDVCWWAWVNKSEQRVRRQADGTETEFTVRITSKVKQMGSLASLKEQFTQEIKQYCIHKYNIIPQHTELKNLRANLKSNECVILVDFSENYSTKYSTEIQSVHFGASRSQVTLHTGVYYTSCGKESFCTISSNLRHDPAAIWAHMRPILTKIKYKYPDITVVHFISDSPSSQYRCVKNLYLMKTLMHQEYGFQHVTWNYTEAGHGKGPADGIGGVLKRTADEVVNAGNDIPDAATLYHSLQKKTCVDLYMVTDADIANIDAIIPTAKTLNALKFPGIMQVHQIRSTARDFSLQHRILSCFCSDLCDFFQPKVVWANVNVSKINDSDKSVSDVSDTRQVAFIATTKKGAAKCRKNEKVKGRAQKSSNVARKVKSRKAKCRSDRQSKQKSSDRRRPLLAERHDVEPKMTIRKPVWWQKRQQLMSGLQCLFIMIIQKFYLIALIYHKMTRL